MIAIYALITIIGLFVGSFITVCIYRIPKGESILKPQSYCFNCGNHLNPLERIPVMSYLMLWGKCKYCKKRLSFLYPFIELLCGLFFVLIFHRFGFSLAFVEYAVLTSILISITVIDIKTMEIPDGINFFGLIMAVFFIIVRFFLFKENLLLHVLGFLAGGGIFLLIALATKAMGGGDIKLMAVLGLWMGLKAILVTTVLSFIIGAIVSIVLLITGKRGRKDFIPFGPFIAVAALLVALYGKEIWNTYITFIL